MSKIKFVRYYKDSCNNDCWDIVYKSGRLKMIINDKLPRTAETFCIMAKNKIQQNDRFNGLETIWSN